MTCESCGHPFTPDPLWPAHFKPQHCRDCEEVEWEMGSFYGEHGDDVDPYRIEDDDWYYEGGDE